MIKLKFNINSSFGRNRGQISSFHRERGRKKLYRLIDFFNDTESLEGVVIGKEKDSFRNAPVALVYNLGGFISYIIAGEGVEIGQKFFKALDSVSEIDKSNLVAGSFYRLHNLPVGSKVFNLEFFPGKGSKISRSAGTFSVLVKKYEKTGLIKLSSGEFRLFSLDCFCCYGRVGNVNFKYNNLKKAGKSRHLGRRPVVRGRAMNPIDHPHGGRTNGGIALKTPWGKLAKGIKTRKKIKAHSRFIVKRKTK